MEDLEQMKRVLVESIAQGPNIVTLTYRNGRNTTQVTGRLYKLSDGDEEVIVQEEGHFYVVRYNDLVDASITTIKKKTV
ncbi:hypothetical protein JCM19037_4748 [Geomicrobium sp. JCM 19037]|uniref:hypothetical protein n=1 Tax=unclassified Geomicrobium TaxID=2628951 RepID=UPI00045F30E5|nr:hypothetical protein [Geomicrobium sp. JCM 19037]GAK06170.1 hypothetical protein JCM19037_4748 [Geomicrobium sp. JCM 19037]